MPNSNFGNALGAFFLGVAEADLAIAAVPLKQSLQNIVANPSPANVVAQAAVLAVALPAALPNIEKSTAGNLAAEALALLNQYVPNPTAG